MMWLQVLVRPALLVLACSIIGQWIGHAEWGVIAGLLIYVLIYQQRLVQLRIWLQHRKHVPLPEVGGVWGEVFDALIDLQRKNRKRKKRLAAMLAEFQASTAALPDGAVVLAGRGEIAWFNEAARKLLGLSAPRDIGLRITHLLRHPRFAEYWSDEEFNSEIEVPSPVNRAKTLSMRVVPYGNQQKLLVVRDISERSLLDAARRDFVSNASHELRTPLTVMRGYLDLLEADAADATRERNPLAPWRSPIHDMRVQALRMEALINDLLRLARLESGHHGEEHEIDVAALVQRALDDARALSAGQHHFELDCTQGTGLVGSESELNSVLSNLLGNAVRYTPPGGVIRVQWRVSGRNERQPQGEARFVVADTGIGIAQADIPRLTERFYRVDDGRSRAQGGTGLGLSIVKHALENFDARLEIESELGVGSTFTCRFPAHRTVRLPTLAEMPR